MVGIELRNMEKKDIDRAAEIHRNILRRGGVSSDPQERRYDISALLGSFLEKTPKTCLVARTEGEVAGFIVGCVKDWGFGVERAGWIELLGVEPRRMGEGIGRKLGRRLLDYFHGEGVEIVYTSVRWDSGDLIEYFKSLNFEKSGFINLVHRRERDRSA